MMGTGHVCASITAALAAAADSGSAFHACERHVRIPDYDVAYVREGHGPPIVLLHGGGTWSYSWRRNIDALAQRYDVIALDMPGHGYTRRTSPLPPSYTLSETTTFLDRTLTALGVRQAGFAGNSWGGGWALAFAQVHPDRVKGLVLIGSSGLPLRERFEWEAMKWPLVGELMIRFAGRADVEKGLKAAVRDPGSVTDADVAAVWAPLRVPEVRAAQVGFIRHLDWRQTQAGMSRVRAPAIVLWGDHDHYVTRADSEALARKLPLARFQVVRGAGHVAQEDQPDAINRAIDDVLTRP